MMADAGKDQEETRSIFAVAGRCMIALLLVLLTAATLIAAADMCRAAAGNPSLFRSIVLSAQKWVDSLREPAPSEQLLRQERLVMDAFRNEKQRWQQMKHEPASRR